jgi:uncharacterized phage protein gp47/JayE
MSSVTISAEGKAKAIIKAVETGPEYNTDAGTVELIVNPSSVAGIESVTNETDITGGRIKETDAEFRARYHKLVDYSGGVNADAIRAALLNDVEGVTSAYVYENDTDEVNAEYNLPAHSIEAVIFGGLDEDIAKTIYTKKAGGIQTIGSTSIDVLTASGQLLPVHFSRPESKKIYIRITNLKTSDEFAGTDAVKQALIGYIGNTSSEGLGVGSAVTYIKIPGILTSLSGIEDFDLEIGTDGVTYSKENISIGYREKAVTDDVAITIEMTGDK